LPRTIAAFEHGALDYVLKPVEAERLAAAITRVRRRLGADRGIGMSWALLFAPDLWPERARDWYSRYEASYWQERGLAAGFREFRPGSWSEWTYEVDAGRVAGGFGTSASAFGIAAARRNSRFDHAYTLASQLVATSWPLPGGTLIAPRAVSHAADAPYLGEAAILYFLTVPPAEGSPS
jgi:hypothetical protein